MTTANLSITDNETVIQYTSLGESAFLYNFPILSTDELKVSVDQVIKTLGVDYTVSGVGDAGGGTVTFLTATTATEIITIWQDMPFKRLTGFATGAAVLAGEALNTEFTRQVRHDQQVRRETGLALRLAVDDPQQGQNMIVPTQATRAGMFLAFDSGGNPTVSAGSGGGDASLRTDLASSVATKGFNLVAISETGAESAAGATLVKPHYGVGNGLRYGMDSSAIDNTGFLQDALDSVPAGGGLVYITEPGTYEFKAITHLYAGASKMCVDITVDGTELYIGPGVTLKLADGEQTDAGGPVDIIVFRGIDGLKIHGKGRVTGNTAGQTGWTGGYAQVLNGNLIRGFDTVGAQNHNVFFGGGLQLDDHFSNPIHSGSGNPGGTNYVIDGILAFNTGEGISIVDIDGVSVSNVDQSDAANVAVGDGIELERCLNFRLYDFYIHDNGVGGAIELSGSKHGVVSNFIIEDWDEATSLGTSGSTTCDDILICNGIIRDCRGTNVLNEAEGSVIYANIRVENSGNLFLLNAWDDSKPPAEFYNVIGIGCNTGIVQNSRKLIWHGGGNRTSGNTGINLTATAPGQTRNIDLSDLDFTNSTGQGIFVSSQAHGAFLVAGRINNVDTEGSSAAFGMADDVDMNAVQVINSGDDEQTINTSTVRDQAGISVLRRSTTQNMITLLATNSTKNQRVLVKATASLTVRDRTDGSGDNLFLAGAANFAMTPGDRLLLEYDAATLSWYEVSRTVT